MVYKSFEKRSLSAPSVYIHYRLRIKHREWHNRSSQMQQRFPSCSTTTVSAWSWPGTTWRVTRMGPSTAIASGQSALGTSCCTFASRMTLGRSLTPFRTLSSTSRRRWKVLASSDASASTSKSGPLMPLRATWLLIRSICLRCQALTIFVH